MKLYFKPVFSLSAILACSLNLFAGDIELIGNKSITFPIHKKDTPLVQKKIKLMHVKLSNEKQALLKQKKFQAYHSNINYPAKVELGMNNVPVFDQGIHGTCSTFALTAAMDAALNKGDYISQLCILELSNYLRDSAWDGSYADYILAIVENFGVINKTNQRNFGCGGLKEYPTYVKHDPTSFIDGLEYKRRSEMIYGNDISWYTIPESNLSDENVNAVKEALLDGKRVSISFLIPEADVGIVGAVARHNTWFYEDTWVLTPEIIKMASHADSAHRVVITGFDDDAVATDNTGKKHQGLFTIRNSWGTSAGDKGNFYMSYDYFKLLAYKFVVIKPTSINN